jgi:hypothetical protein
VLTDGDERTWKESKAALIKAESLIKPKIKDEPPVTPATVRRYKSGALISAPTSAAKRRGATVTCRALAASDTDTGESAGEGENEGESKRKGTGDPRGSEDLQDIREMLDEAEKPTE